MRQWRGEAIGPLFVLLHLLEGNAERLRERALAEVEHKPAHAHAAADDYVGLFWMFGHSAPESMGKATRNWRDLEMRQKLGRVGGSKRPVGFVIPSAGDDIWLLKAEDTVLQALLQLRDGTVITDVGVVRPTCAVAMIADVSRRRCLETAVSCRQPLMPQQLKLSIRWGCGSPFCC